MAKKVILKDDNVEIMPITRGELILDSSGQLAFHSSQFLATQSLPGLMSGEDKTKLDSLEKVTVEDKKVKQVNTTTNSSYRILFSNSADDKTKTEGARKSAKLLFNPSTGALTATALIGKLNWSNLNNVPKNFTPAQHIHNTSEITALTSYSKASSASDLVTTDTLNAALGKLEYKADTAYDWVISVTSTDTDEYINKWGEIVGFLDSVKEGTDILDEFVTRKTTLVITGQKNFNTNTGAAPVIISRGGGSTEAVAIGINDSQAVFKYTNDEKANSYVFKMINTDTEASDGSGANTSLVTFAGSSAGSSVTATTFIGRLNNTLTFSAGAFATKTYNNSSAVTVNIPTHTSHLTNNSGFLTSRGYIGTTAVLASSATQNLTGIGSASFSGIVTINTSIQNHSSPTALCLVINSTKIPDGTTLSLKNSPGIGFHIANHSWGSLVFNGNFNFINNDATSFMPVKASKFITNGGTSSLFVKGDGSLDSNTYLTSHLSLANYVTLNGTLTISGVKTFSTLLKFTVALGTSPFTVTSTTKVNNLNADLLDGFHLNVGSKGKCFGKIPVIGFDGVTELGPYIDWHYDNTTVKDYSTRLQVSGNHGNTVNLPSASGTLALTSQIPTSLPANGGNADTVDGYHASGLWRSDGGVWNPTANILLNATANGQEWSFDITRNGKTGCYWHVWDSALGAMLKVNADDGKVSAPYGFVGNLTGNATSASKLTTVSKTAWGQTYWTNGGVPTSISGNMTGVGSITMTGAINYAGSKATYPMIKFIDNTSNGNGNGIVIGGGGTTIIGGGEAGDLFISAGAGGNESLILASDSTITLYTNCQDGTSKAKSVSMDANGYLNTSYIYYGGHEKNASNPSYVAGFNSSDKYIRSYATSSLSVNYASSSGTCNGNAKGLYPSGYGNGNFTYYQTSSEFFGNSGWAHYLIANHGDGSNYYNYTIALPFWDVPKYKRLEGGTADGWHTFITSENIGSLSVNYASSAGSVAWANVTGKPSTFTPSSHTHDDRYYTESEADSRFINASGDTMTGPLTFANGTWNVVGDDAAIGDYNAAGMLGLKSINNNIPGIGFHNSSNTLLGRLQASGSNLLWNDNKIWHAGNDGSGSGLDADLLDGKHASAFATSGHTHSYLTSGATLSGDNHAAALKTYFTNNKASIPRNSLNTYYSSAMSNGSLYFGYFLSGYDTSPYGGFFVAHYDNAYYVGISNGYFTQQRILTSTNYSSYLGYIGTTAVLTSSAAQALTGITNATLSGKLIFTTAGEAASISFLEGELIDGYGNVLLGTNSASWNVFSSSRSSLITVIKSGNVGIGTTSPSYKLHVNGQVYSTGYVKASSSDSYVLLGGGGHKALSDFAMASAYVKKAGDTMTGVLSMKNDVNPRILFIPNSGSSTLGAIYLMGGSSTAYSGIKYKFRQWSYTANSLTRLSYYEDYNLPETPAGLTANASYTILTTKNASVSGGGSSWGSSITVKIDGVTKTLTIPSNPNTWRPITNSYSSTATDTSLSLKGANDLYNALVNGYASSAGNADTVDSCHKDDFLRRTETLGYLGKFVLEDIPKGVTQVGSIGWTDHQSYPHAGGLWMTLRGTSSLRTALILFPSYSMSSPPILYSSIDGGAWQGGYQLAYKSQIPTTMAWGSITGKPSTFTPSSHTHSYVTPYGEGSVANTRSANYDVAVCSGGWASTSAGYGSLYGTTLDVSGYSTWYHRLAFRTDGRIEYWQGINTKTMTRYGTLAWISDIPSVGNGTVTIKQAGVSKGSFTMNQSGNTTIELTDSNTTYSTKSFSVNGTGYNIYTSSSSLPTIYAPTSVGTSGYIVQSYGNGAPSWVKRLTYDYPGVLWVGYIDRSYSSTTWTAHKTAGSATLTFTLSNAATYKYLQVTMSNCTAVLGAFCSTREFYDSGYKTASSSTETTGRTSGMGDYLVTCSGLSVYIKKFNLGNSDNDTWRNNGLYITTTDNGNKPVTSFYLVIIGY